MKISAYYTDTSYVALGMLKGYLRIHDPELFQTIEWLNPEENGDKHFFFFDSLSDMDKEKAAVESMAAKSIPSLKVIMTEEPITSPDPMVTGWSLEKLRQFLLS